MENNFSDWSKNRFKHFQVIQRYINHEITKTQAAQLAGISDRQVTRIAKEIRELGAEALLHKNKGRKPANSVSPEMETNILNLYSQPEYHDVNFLHFQDSLAARHKISCPYSTLTSILKKAGKVSPKKKKHRKKHCRRKRKAYMGELIQIDASPHDWLRNGRQCSLHGAIDDATGMIVGLYLCENECRLGYFETMRQCLLNHGSPLSLYSDNHSIFRSPKAGKSTQFGRAMHELGANIIYAKSPQAKGRVERMWETLQSRLPVEFALDKISTIAEANVYLETKVISYFNERWAQNSQASIFVPVPTGTDIDTILCVKERRVTDNAGAFSYKGKAFQIIDDGFPVISRGKKVELLIGWRIGIKIRYQERIFGTVRYLEPLCRSVEKPVSPKIKKATLPHLKHSSPEWVQIWHTENYNLSLQFLFDLFLSKQDVIGQITKIAEKG
jgi:hypothetical protein